MDQRGAHVRHAGQATLKASLAVLVTALALHLCTTFLSSSLHHGPATLTQALAVLTAGMLVACLAACAVEGRALYRLARTLVAARY